MNEYEYTVIEIANHVDKQSKFINDMALKGWELVEVDFNRGYFRRPKQKVKFGKEENGN